MKPPAEPQSLWQRILLFLLRLPPPADGWEGRIRCYFQTGQANPLRYPVEWTVLRHDPTWTPQEGQTNTRLILEEGLADQRCAVSGSAFYLGEDMATQRRGPCRCARCAALICQRYAGVATVADVPACPKCSREVHSAINRALNRPWEVE